MGEKVASFPDPPSVYSFIVYPLSLSICGLFFFLSFSTALTDEITSPMPKSSSQLISLQYRSVNAQNRWWRTERDFKLHRYTAHERCGILSPCQTFNSNFAHDMVLKYIFGSPLISYLTWLSKQHNSKRSEFFPQLHFPCPYRFRCIKYVGP